MKKRGLAIAGDFYHDIDNMREFIRSASPEWLQWDWLTLPPDIDLKKFNKDCTNGYDIIIVSAENRIAPETGEQLWMDESFAEILSTWVKNGGGFISLHTGMASYPDTGIYRKMIGGAFEFHPVKHPVFDIVPNPEAVDHPLMEGIERFTITDELYFVVRDPNKSQLLAVSDSPEYGGSSAFWCRSHGSGRIVGLTPGHNKDTQENRMLVKMLSNSMLWCLNMK